ncbi:MAG: lytic transglycosylase domain-containing protein [Planctomycetes bacterium]|nr:lytic transglycosylase domain-containing protein [Planctomycetota bacterium]MBL7009048.1 lytic transglycosylase domain-containing protein [Planctomycetota bacterium]
MDQRTRRRLSAFLLSAFGLTVLGVLAQRSVDGVLRVEGWAAEIRSAAGAAGLEDPGLLAGLVYAESRGRQDARSSIGASGLCQLLPATAAELAARYGVEDPEPPAANLLLGAHYLAEQLRAWDGDARFGLLAYRLGPGAVARGVAQAGGPQAWLDQLKARKPSPWEYVVQVTRFRDRFHERGRI